MRHMPDAEQVDLSRVDWRFADWGEIEWGRVDWDSIPWATIPHFSGDCGAVPQALEDLHSADRHTAMAADGFLDNEVVRQGYLSKAAPFVCAALVDRLIKYRGLAGRYLRYSLLLEFINGESDEHHVTLNGRAATLDEACRFLAMRGVATYVADYFVETNGAHWWPEMFGGGAPLNHYVEIGDVFGQLLTEGELSLERLEELLAGHPREKSTDLLGYLKREWLEVN